jgi:YidC/Oxa1 family membrane protein insertase
MVLALVLSFLFFIAYEYFLMPQKAPYAANEINSTKNIQASAQAAPTAVGTTAAPVDQSAAASTQAPLSTPIQQHDIIAVVTSEKFRAEIDSLGRISKYEVLIERFKDKEGNYPNIISDKSALRPLEIRFSDPTLNSEAFETNYHTDSASLEVINGDEVLTLTQKLSATTVTKKITFHKDGSYALHVALSSDIPYFISPGFRPDAEADMYTFKGVLIRKAEGNIETIEDGDATGSEVFHGATIVAANDKYYTTSFYDLDNSMSVFISKDAQEDPLAFVKGSSNLKINGYIGAKEYDILKAIDPRLTQIIEYGFFTFISKPLFVFLKYIYSIVGNWGWAIIIITLIIRLILYPLTYKGMVSMNKLKALSPKIKEIQQQHKGDPQKMNAKMMELYKKHGANPMGGCLPMLMQIPVFFAIYRVLLNSIELKHAPWIGWIQDLSVMDPYYVLPILMGASMFWQQRITPTNFTDPMQEKIMKFLPVIFTFFFVTFPAGLTLYWFVNNLFSVAQQYYVNSIFAKQEKEKAALS